ncbi:Dual serine/threonine and tyrosine protein kinase [Hypsibius exemplaris]|uniref:Dual serine/threonine and tyrosine protein kinase n=1 Tax=Hypsibius exemplaris TaxID=2072580 RepID=A0A1W0X8Q2_HYPEX|nr:Dual serine/threonine and tyrosine protein kinase [Hypsibius exemplaris]
MSASLAQEIRKYLKICKLLRQNFRDTKSALRELMQSEQFDAEFLANVAILRAEEQLVQQVTERAPSVIVLGQDYAAKLAVVNALLGQPFLPPNLTDSPDGWRMLRIIYGLQKTFSLSLAGNFEVVDAKLARVGGVAGTGNNKDKETVPFDDFILKNAHVSDSAAGSAVLEISLSHDFLMSGWRIIVSPSQHHGGIEPVFRKCTEGALPVYIYVLSGQTLSDLDLEYLAEHKRLSPHSSILYLCSDGEPPILCPSLSPDVVPRQDAAGGVFQQLMNLGYLDLPIEDLERRKDRNVSLRESELVYGDTPVHSIVTFAKKVLSAKLLEVGSCLYSIHERTLKMFTNISFDIARDALITPRRLMYVRTKEIELYDNLSSIANKKQEEIEKIIQETVDNIREPLLDEAEAFQFQNVDFSEGQENIQTAKELQICTEEIRDLILSKINCAVAGKLIGSVNCLREICIGTLCRCLESLELTGDSNYPSAANALKQIFNAAYQIHLNAATSSSVSHLLYERLRTFLQSLRWTPADRIDNSWKRLIADEMMTSLSAPKLAKNICSQFRDRLRHAHDVFLLSIRQLECKHADRLEKMEQKRLNVRRLHSPKISKLALESASMKDLIVHGNPRVGREIGRGQYGVVYSCDSWAGFSPCAVKSVVPPDDKHWNDLAMEFYFTRGVPKHPRIISLYGSIIDYTYGDGGATSGPAVLFIMERLPRDLHAALKTGVPWGSRLQIAIDVIEGVRFLHSQGLVHRDIKLKNVLLDKSYRAKLTDLGFCKPEAMLSGSIVGTPIHMAPEIFTGRHYDHSVDIYAFGILFWFLCTGTVKLPTVFEPSMSKDMLKCSVRKGIRPERMPYFDEQCWNLMNACWSSEPYLRPLPGYIEPKLREIHSNYKRGCQTNTVIRQKEVVVGSPSGSPYVEVDILSQ